ncbi:MAG: hypothetical protein K2Y22_07930 [Candidatus Obscuribacterales bacterium]|nr:hypothetical protein [Candidatus Obscuribacterales bacterium]
MHKHQHFALLLAFSTVISCGAAFAQGGPHDSEETHPWRDIEYQPSPGNMMAPPGRSYRTDTQGVTDYNAPMLPETETPCLAKESVSDKPIPSNKYNFGFKAGEQKNYQGAYSAGGGGSSIGGGGKQGANLPPVGTGSVDIDLGK